MEIRPAQREDLQPWVALRHALWPDDDLPFLRAEAEKILASHNEVCFLGFEQSAAVGFVEGQIYQGAEGPYAHVEGWYVQPASRRHGYGSQLIGRLEQWCLHRAIRILTSDTTPRYPLSPSAHQASGFRIIKQFTIFMKDLNPHPPVSSAAKNQLK
jgi:aminoglycoside 6'-N-acetyltransferase I